jgi:hypothetical protein
MRNRPNEPASDIVDPSGARSSNDENLARDNDEEIPA